MVDQHVAYVGYVERGRMLDQVAASFGDDDDGAALVGWAGLAPDEAAALHPGQMLRQAAFLPAQQPPEGI